MMLEKHFGLFFSGHSVHMLYVCVYVQHVGITDLMAHSILLCPQVSSYVPSPIKSSSIWCPCL